MRSGYAPKHGVRCRSCILATCYSLRGYPGRPTTLHPRGPLVKLHWSGSAKPFLRVDLFPVGLWIQADRRPCIDRLFLNNRLVIRQGGNEILLADVRIDGNGDVRRVGETQRMEQLCLSTKIMSIRTS